MPDGTDSPLWRALSAQVMSLAELSCAFKVIRLRPESVAVGPEAPAKSLQAGCQAEMQEEESSSSGSESGGLLEVAEMHRSQRRPQDSDALT